MNLFGDTIDLGEGRRRGLPSGGRLQRRQGFSRLSRPRHPLLQASLRLLHVLHPGPGVLRARARGRAQSAGACPSSSTRTGRSAARSRTASTASTGPRPTTSSSGRWPTSTPWPGATPTAAGSSTGPRTPTACGGGGRSPTSSRPTSSTRSRSGRSATSLAYLHMRKIPSPRRGKGQRDRHRPEVLVAALVAREVAERLQETLRGVPLRGGGRLAGEVVWTRKARKVRRRAATGRRPRSAASRRSAPSGSTGGSWWGRPTTPASSTTTRRSASASSSNATACSTPWSGTSEAAGSWRATSA